MSKPRLKHVSRQIIGNVYTWAGLGAGFFLGSARLMERNGIQHFQYVGGRYNPGPQTGTPGMLYAVGWGIVCLMGLRALRRRMAEVKAYRAKAGDPLFLKS